jgi:hypothetical protein
MGIHYRSSRLQKHTDRYCEAQVASILIVLHRCSVQVYASAWVASQSLFGHGSGFLFGSLTGGTVSRWLSSQTRIQS